MDGATYGSNRARPRNDVLCDSGPVDPQRQCALSVARRANQTDDHDPSRLGRAFCEEHRGPRCDVGDRTSASRPACPCHALERIPCDSRRGDALRLDGFLSLDPKPRSRASGHPLLPLADFGGPGGQAFSPRARTVAAMGGDLAWIRGCCACKRNLGIPIFDGYRSRPSFGVLLGDRAFDVAKRVEGGRSLDASRILQCDLCDGDAHPCSR
jgi:hypothetical protein